MGWSPPLALPPSDLPGYGGHRLDRLRFLLFVVLRRVVRIRKRRVFILVVALASFKLIVEYPFVDPFQPQGPLPSILRFCGGGGWSA